MSPATALASACLDADQLVAIGATANRRFVPTIRVHQRTLKRWLATAVSPVLFTLQWSTRTPASLTSS